MLLSILIISFVLITLALLFLYKSRKSLHGNNKMGSSESVRYDSKISLCTLIFDQANSVLYISYGKKNSQINFSAISAFEVAIDSHCAMKISNNAEQVFDDVAEEHLLAMLQELENEKLLADATRQITLEIFSESDAGVKPVLVNFYYREGDLRLSPHPFARSAEDLLLWCDLLESAIRPDTDTAEEMQTEVEKEVTKSFNIFSEPAPVSEVVHDSAEHQTLPNNHDLADELTRLSELKAKGFLSDEEFSKAKNKIIN